MENNFLLHKQEEIVSPTIVLLLFKIFFPLFATGKHITSPTKFLELLLMARPVEVCPTHPITMVTEGKCSYTFLQWSLSLAGILEIFSF